MKKLAPATVGCLLVIVAQLLATPRPHSAAVSASRISNRQEPNVQLKNVRMKTGPELAERVQKLKQDAKSIRAAFAAFERRGRAPQIEDALAIFGEVSPAATAAHTNAQGLFRKAKFAPQDQTVVSGNGYELILVPSIETYEEWQGTAICTKYDEQGNVLERYTANIVSFADSQGNPIIRYQVNYAADGTPYLSHSTGMYSGYALGTLYRDHQALYGAAPPLKPESWQFLTPEDEQLYYNSYPEQQESPGGGIKPIQQMSQWGGATFVRASFAPAQARQDRHIERHQMKCGTPARPQACGPGVPTLESYLKHSAAGCATAALCGSNVRCRAVACVGSFISNLPVLFGW